MESELALEVSLLSSGARRRSDRAVLPAERGYIAFDPWHRARKFRHSLPFYHARGVATGLGVATILLPGSPARRGPHVCVMEGSDATARSLEDGDLFFFYRPRVGVERVEDLDDVQRLFMIMAPRRPGRRRLRMVVIGRKKLPQIGSVNAHPDERSWAMIAMVTSSSEEIRRELAAQHYATKTRGIRAIGSAKPVGEGRYQLALHHGHSELAYVLELPRHPGLAQEEFEIKREASYIVAVRNPCLAQPVGIPAPRQRPDLPKELRDLFGDRRWISISNPELLDYAYTQLVLVGAHRGAVREELGLDIEEKSETERSADVFRALEMSRRAIPVTPLFEGRFPEDELEPRRQW